MLTIRSRASDPHRAQCILRILLCVVIGLQAVVGACTHEPLDKMSSADLPSPSIEPLQQAIDQDHPSSRSPSSGSDADSSLPRAAPPHPAQDAFDSAPEAPDDLSAATGADASPLSRPVRLASANYSAPPAPSTAADLRPPTQSPLTDW